jgi:hypothetical protein
MSAREDARLVYQAFVDKEIAYLQRGLEEIEKQLSLSDREGQAGGVPQLLRASAPANSCGGVEGHAELSRSNACTPLRESALNKGTASSGYQAPPAGLRITEAPEPHEPTKVLGWLLVGFAGFCVYVLGATIFKFWPVIVRTLR